jgi:hypothetical protein
MLSLSRGSVTNKGRTMISKTRTPVCQSGGEIITDDLWVVRHAFVENRPEQMIVCIACDLKTPQNDLDWYNRRQQEGNRSCS